MDRRPRLWADIQDARRELVKTVGGLIAIAATFIFLCFELLHCYGFLPCCNGVNLRSAHREFQGDMHDITEHVERIAMMVLLIAFGGALVGGLLVSFGWLEGGRSATDPFRCSSRHWSNRPNWGQCNEERNDHHRLFRMRGVSSFYYLATV